MKKQKTKGKDKKEKENIELPKPMEPQKSIADIIADREGLVHFVEVNMYIKQQFEWFFFRLQRNRLEGGRKK